MNNFAGKAPAPSKTKTLLDLTVAEVKKLPEYIAYEKAHRDREQARDNYDNPLHPAFEVDPHSDRLKELDENKTVAAAKTALREKLSKVGMDKELMGDVMNKIDQDLRQPASMQR